MSTKSNDQGRAYEYAWINVLNDVISESRPVSIVANSSLEANKRAWDSITTDKQHTYKRSANAAVLELLGFEPQIFDDAEDVVLLEFQQDGVGTEGDVRDIIIKRPKVCWEVGLSIKHNHQAVKHSRLSHRLDFGNEWFDIPCSKEYWNSVSPIFDRLKTEKTRGTKWSDIPDKDVSVYVPLLEAFMQEVQKAYSSDESVPRKMVEYLIGVNDYYKIISRDAKRLTVIRTFNLHGTLGKESSRAELGVEIPITDLPTELIELRLKPNSTNTVEMYLNNGWQLSFRIHNASTRVEPSLKFDVQFIGMPQTILSFECKWQ